MDTKSKRYKVSLTFIVLYSLGAAFLVVVSSAKYGPGMTHDSAAYMYAAESLINGDGIQYFGYPSPFIQWPPLFPMLLALGGLAGLEPGSTSIFINSITYALTVFFAGRWMLDRFKFSAIAVGGTLLLFLSVPLLQVSKYLWSEMIFILFFFLFYIEFERFLRHGHYRSLALAALFSALACIDRYAGVTIVAAAGLSMLFTKKNLLKRIADAAFYGLISVIPMSIWVVRNYLVSGTLLGVRLPSTYTLKQNIKRSLESIYTWVQPDKLLSQHTNGFLLNSFELFAILLPVLVIAAIFIITARSLAGDPQLHNLPGEMKLELVQSLPIMFFALFSIIYVVYLVASATTVAFEPINSRYLVPAYLPVLLMLLTITDYLFNIIEGRFKIKFTRFLICALLSLYLIYPAANMAASVWSSYLNGSGGYATYAWQNRSGFIQYMKNPGQCTYYSNNADVVYALSGIRTYYPPKKNGPDMYGLGQFQAAVSQDENSYVIWFENGVPQTLYSLEELGELYGLEEVGSFENGKVFRLLK